MEGSNGQGNGTGSLRAVDGFRLGQEHRALLRPGEMVLTAEQRHHRLPRYFLEVESWAAAKSTQLTRHFTLSELLVVDVRETALLLRYFPHYVPCAVLILARYLQEFRDRAETTVHIAANGGYRSPAHEFSRAGASPHAWGVAANIYRVGDTLLDNQKTIERYARLAESIGPEVRTKPYGIAPGETTDHLHIDLGYIHLIPPQFSEEELAEGETV